MGNLWSKAKVISEIQHLHKQEVKLNSGSVRKTHLALYGAAYQYFGGWRHAIEASGLDYEKVAVRLSKGVRQSWSKKKITTEIQKLHKKGARLNARYALLNLPKLYAAACHYFGSWKDALNAAGLDEKKIRKRPEFKTWSKSAVIAGVQSRFTNKLPLNSKTVEDTDLALYRSGVSYFGSWKDALKAAGFNPDEIYLSRTKPWTKREFKKTIHELHIQGSSLSMVNMVRLGRGDLLNASRKLYGSWKEALQALGLNYEDIRERRTAWTADEVTLIIQHLASEGYRLSHGWTKLNHNGLTHAARFHFGNWDNALTAAGLNYREHAKYWSTEAWLRHLSDEEYDALLGRPGKNTT